MLSLLIAPDNRPVAWGLLLGFAFSLLKLYLASGALLVFAGLAPDRARSFMVQRRFLSYGLTAVVLVIAFGRREEINPWATVAGIFLTSLILFADALRRGRSEEPPEEGT